MSQHLPSWAECSRASCTTTPGWRWRRSWGMVGASVPGAFTELQSHYLFEDRLGRPGKGNDKGKVEGTVGYVRRNFLVPVPSFASFDALNAHLKSPLPGSDGPQTAGTLGDRRPAYGAGLGWPAAPAGHAL